MAVNPEAMIARADDCLSAQVGDRLVLMSMKAGHYLALDAIASDIWERLSVPQRLSELCGQLAGAYEATPDTIFADVEELISKLSSSGAITITG